MAQQLENEKRLIGDASTKTLLKEMWVIPGNRKRAIISVMLMIWQQMTGVNAIVSSPRPSGSSGEGRSSRSHANALRRRTTTPLKSSPVSE